MAINARSVQGRRQLRFNSLDEVVAEAERLAATPGCRTLGNWPLDSLLMHLAAAIDGSVDGLSITAPWYFRLLGMAIKRRALARGVQPGFNLPKERIPTAFPTAPSMDAALETLRTAIYRLDREQATAYHPIFGKLTHEEWRTLHLRHAEMHLSFIVPG